MKNYKELETKCKAFDELQCDFQDMVSRYETQKGFYDDTESEYHTEQRNILGMKINIIEKMLEHLDKLF